MDKNKREELQQLMDDLLASIIEQDGYQEMADGAEQMKKLVEKFLKREARQ